MAAVKQWAHVLKRMEDGRVMCEFPRELRVSRLMIRRVLEICPGVLFIGNASLELRASNGIGKYCFVEVVERSDYDKKEWAAYYRLESITTSTTTPAHASRQV